MNKAGRVMLAILVGGGFALSSPGAFASDLESSMRAALDNSALLSSARQSWIGVREDINTNSVTTDWRATGALSGKGSKYDSPATSGYKSSESTSASITFSKNLYDGGQEAEGTKLGLINLAAQTAHYQASEQTVLLRAITAHLSVVKAEREVALNEDNVSRLEAHVNAANVRLQAGAATPTRLAEAEARLARAKSTLIVAQNALQNARDEYHSVTGIEAVNLQVPPGVSDLPKTMIEAEDIGQASHPDVKLQMANEDAAEQGFETLLASVRPTISLDVSASETQATGTVADKTELSAQITLSTPLMVTPATTAKSRNLSAKLAAARFARDAAIRDVALTIRKTFRSLNTARSQITAVTAEVQASRLVAEGIRNEFEFGQKTNLDVQDAEQDVNDAEIRFVAAQHDLLLSSYRMQSAIGQLTAAAMGLGDVLGPLQDAPQPEPYFSSILPISGK